MISFCSFFLFENDSLTCNYADSTTILERLQTGKYVVRAEDLPRASKLPCAQRPVKRTKYGKYAGKIHYTCGGVARVVFPSANVTRKNILRAENKLSSPGKADQKLHALSRISHCRGTEELK